MHEDDAMESMLDELFARAKVQFGPAAQSCWLYDQDACPGCGRAIDAMKYKGKESVSLNAFIHRPRGVLIGYLLCKRCATKIFRASERNPMQQIPLHGKIEQSLIHAYQKYCNSMDA